MTRPFSLERLEQLLVRPHTFRRHDVDYSVSAAMLMARFEADLGVSSTYYVMTTSPFYSPTEAFALATVVSGLGHQVGWHVDGRKTLVSRIAQLAPDTQISFHCPRPSDLWRRFPGVRSAYDPIWKDAYYADSRGRFAYGDPEDAPAGTTIQINLHPEWWFEPRWHQQVSEREYADFFHEPKSSLAA